MYLFQIILGIAIATGDILSLSKPNKLKPSRKGRRGGGGWETDLSQGHSPFSDRIKDSLKCGYTHSKVIKN